MPPAMTTSAVALRTLMWRPFMSQVFISEAPVKQDAPAVRPDARREAEVCGLRCSLRRDEIHREAAADEDEAGDESDGRCGGEGARVLRERDAALTRADSAVA